MVKKESDSKAMLAIVSFLTNTCEVEQSCSFPDFVMIQSFLSPTTLPLGRKLLPGATAPLHTINSQALMWKPAFPPTSLLKSLPLIDNTSPLLGSNP